MNKLWTDGWREFGRLADRADCRLRLLRARHDLRLAEIHLGDLGWQQADFDPAGNHAVRRLNTIELDQARLTNELADLAEKIHTLQRQSDAEIDALKTASEVAHSGIEPLRRRHRVDNAQLRQEQKKLDHVLRGIGDVEMHARQAERHYQGLLASPAASQAMVAHRTAAARDIQALDGTMRDLQSQRLDLSASIAELSEKVIADRDLITFQKNIIAGNVRRIAKLRTNVHAQVHGLEKERHRLRHERNALDLGKRPHFQRIGAALADARIAPMNQPHVLATVFAHRAAIAKLLGNLASLRLKSAAASAATRFIAVVYAIILTAAAFAFLGLEAASIYVFFRFLLLR